MPTRSVPAEIRKAIHARRPKSPVASVPKVVHLPKRFLDGPAPNLEQREIDFKEEGLTEYAGHWAVVLDGVLTEEECDQIVALAEASADGKWERAMVNVGGGQQMLYEDTRKCGRIIWDNHELAKRLWKRVEQAPAVSKIQRLEKWASVTGYGPWKRDEVWKMTRLNERLRLLKYTGGEYFKVHQDGIYETVDKKERSYFTLHLYLNNAEGKNGEESLKGGATTFDSHNMHRRIEVVPKVGRVLLFQQRGLLHSGDDVISGTKLTMRTDIMFAKED
ncbi:oxidoreductase domain-containing protein [Pleomassaria siparia CBS 279.74]|uniref:Oxidoreductase domain-containing protein n=1 Tax=Pleomassaria siparia CBS 279.74 TaxID=1314801 RepID=A0A6G1KMT4_9PLEO|nr:oxidoreductase domain-containing protein [Pleomassaria siparia CBS 279.74]